MLSFQVTEDDVFSLLPSNLKKPSEVASNPNSRGISITTFNQLQVQYNAYINAELLKNSIPLPKPSNVHPLLRSAQSNLIAGAIVRMYDNPQNPYKDLFATGNIMLRQYIDEYKLLHNISSVGAPDYYIDEEAKSVFSFLKQR